MKNGQFKIYILHLNEKIFQKKKVRNRLFILPIHYLPIDLKGSDRGSIQNSVFIYLRTSLNSYNIVLVYLCNYLLYFESIV